MTEAIKMAARMDLSVVESFVNELNQKDFSGDVTLDASEVTHLGAICAQAIVAGARASASAGGQFKIVDLSEAVQAQLAFMGMTVENLESGLV